MSDQQYYRILLDDYSAASFTSFDGAEFIKKRLLGLERVGIVPNEVMPFYCHSRFPGEDVDSFRHLNHENPDAEIALIEWQPIKPVKLKENAHE